MEAINIFYVRLESGENIAQYTSLRPLPESGAILDLSSIGADGIFEVLAAKVTHFIEPYQIVVLTVRESSLPSGGRKIITGEAHKQVEVINRTPTPFSAILRKPGLLGLVLGAAVIIVLRFLNRYFTKY